MCNKTSFYRRWMSESYLFTLFWSGFVYFRLRRATKIFIYRRWMSEPCLVTSILMRVRLLSTAMCNKKTSLSKMNVRVLFVHLLFDEDLFTFHCDVEQKSFCRRWMFEWYLVIYFSWRGCLLSTAMCNKLSKVNVLAFSRTLGIWFLCVVALGFESGVEMVCTGKPR